MDAWCFKIKFEKERYMKIDKKRTRKKANYNENAMNSALKSHLELSDESDGYSSSSSFEDEIFLGWMILRDLLLANQYITTNSQI